MNVLYAGSHYPKLSESYMAAEIRYASSVGVNVAVWSPEPGAPGAPELVPVYRGSLKDAMKAFRPDVVHAYYAFGMTWPPALEPAFRAGIPVTVRGHRFPNELEGALALARHPGVARVWMFPQFAELCSHEKIRPLPVAFDSTRFKPASYKNTRLVVRTAAGKPNKGLRDFIEIARRRPEFTFKLVVDRSGYDSYFAELEREAKGVVEFLYSIPDEAAAALVSRAGIYLGTADLQAGSPFGMPISFAEAMATGSLVLVREVPYVDEFLGLGGFGYTSIDEAAEDLRATLSWDGNDWRQWADKAITRAHAFKDSTVLPEVIREWEILSIVK